MIELIAARGNTSLESAVALTKTIRWHIQDLGRKLAQTAANEESLLTNASRTKSREQSGLDRKMIVKDIKTLISRIDDAVPLINLAITTSGVSLSTNLPVSISPSRLLQASTFLSAGDSSYIMDSARSVQVGPRFTVSMYMLFMGHANKVVDEEGLRTTIWKEVMHKAQVKLLRVALDDLSRCTYSETPDAHTTGDIPTCRANDYFEERIPAESRSSEFAYQLSIIEDLDDDRVHTFDDGETPTALDDVKLAGLRTFIPIHEIARIFYADTGKILNMGSEGESSSPVLLLKRDHTAAAPRRAMQEVDAHFGASANNTDGNCEDFLQADHQNPQNKQASSIPQGRQARSRWDLPADLDPEWIAFEVYNEDEDTDSDEETEIKSTTKAKTSRPPSSHGRESIDTSFATALARLRISPSVAGTPNRGARSMSAADQTAHQVMPLAATSSVTTSLSLLEMLIRLTSLQQFQQCSHLAINDELLNFFLEESSTTGAATGDAEARKRVRMEARQHVGFDPYDESPIKRRGEAYQRRSDGGFDHDGEWTDTEVPMSSPPLTRPHFSPVHSRSYTTSSPRGPSTSTRSTPSKSTPPLPGQSSSRGFKDGSPLTMPSNVRSRQDFLSAESSTPNGGTGRGSPLATEYMESSEDIRKDGGST